MKEFEARLHECLEALREGRWSIEECLERYPEHADELRPYLLTAKGVTQAYNVAPREQFAADARERFLIATGQRLSEAYETEPELSFFAAARVRFLMAAHRLRTAGDIGAPRRRSLPLFGTPFRALATAGAAAALFLSFSTYTVASANNALPGDWQYGVKLQTERVRLALAFSDDAKREVRLDLASERAQEIERLAKKGRIIGPGELDRLASQTEGLAEDAGPDWDADDLTKLQAVASRQKQLLQEVAPQVADDAQEQLDQAVGVSETAASRASEALARKPDLPPLVTTPSQLLTSTPEPEDTPTPDATPTAGETPGATETPASELPTAEPTAEPGAVNVGPNPVDTTLGVSWVRLAVGQLTALIPSEADGWRIAGINVADGPVPAPALIRLTNFDGTSLVTLNPRNGDMYWFIERDRRFDEVQMRLTRDGQTLVVDRDVLRGLYGERAEIALFIMDSIEILPVPEPTATPEPPPPPPVP